MPENRRFGVPRDGHWLHYVGDCGAAAGFLESRSPATGWVLVMFLDALLRSFGQLVLANNPLSGAVVLTALCAVQPWAGLAALSCASIAILVAAAAGQQRGAVSAGMASCAAALLGAATVCLLQPEALDGRVWTLLYAAAVVSVYVTSSLNTLVSAVLPPAWWGTARPSGGFSRPQSDDVEQVWNPPPGKGPWPPLFALPYSLLQLVFFLCLMHSEGGLLLRPLGPTGAPGDVLNVTEETTLAATAVPTASADVNVTRVREFYDIDHLDWGQMFQGVLVSASQVVAMEDPAVSAAVYIALLLFSPVAACAALAGAFLGSLAGVGLLEPPYTDVYRGLWGVNGLLSMWAISAHSFVLSWHSLAAGAACTLLGAGLQAALGAPLRAAGLPVLLLPHSLSALVFLLVASSARTAFVRPAVLSFPEKHKYDFWTEHEDETDGDDDVTSKRPASPAD
ncbi:urea transporter 1-like isoform X2 [Frankliniella occidentalis]|uniref:Urea transporter 1-like isoform X2 n=1 Tax=Frankliniella occidentalis TaxID=133901 RepID=A0A9C6TUZ1_FRAOC|nr:urea transporter 1-like isoform X2 [Frankliniella occidentalis]